MQPLPRGKRMLGRSNSATAVRGGPLLARLKRHLHRLRVRPVPALGLALVVLLQMSCFSETWEASCAPVMPDGTSHTPPQNI